MPFQIKVLHLYHKTKQKKNNTMSRTETTQHTIQIENHKLELFLERLSQVKIEVSREREGDFWTSVTFDRLSGLDEMLIEVILDELE